MIYYWTLLACSSRNYIEGVYVSNISYMIAEIYLSTHASRTNTNTKQIDHPLSRASIAMV